MTQMDKPECEKVTGESILMYLEREMPPDQQAQFELHIQGCSRCSERLSRMENMISTLKMEKEAFCPEPWELHDYVMKSRASPELIRHVERCPSCQEQIESYKMAGEEISVPPTLRDAFRQRFSKRESSSGPTSLTSSIIEWLERLRLSLNMPLMALGTAAAVVLLVVVLYPRGDTAPVIGLSSVYWPTSYVRTPYGGDHTLGLDSQPDRLKPIPDIGSGPLGADQQPEVGDLYKPRLAIVLALKGFRQPLTQERIDSLYRDLAPSTEVKKHYHILDPAQIKASIRASGVALADRKALLNHFRKDMSVSSIMVVTVKKKDATFDVEARMIATETGQIKRTVIKKDVSETQLATSLRKTTFRTLLSDK